MNEKKRREIIICNERARGIAYLPLYANFISISDVTLHIGKGKVGRGDIH